MTPGAIEKLREALAESGRMSSYRAHRFLVDAVQEFLAESTAPVPCVECERRAGDEIRAAIARAERDVRTAKVAHKEALEKAARIVEADLDPLGDMVDTGEAAHLNRKLRRMAREIRALGSEDKNT